MRKAKLKKKGVLQMGWVREVEGQSSIKGFTYWQGTIVSRRKSSRGEERDRLDEPMTTLLLSAWEGQKKTAGGGALGDWGECRNTSKGSPTVSRKEILGGSNGGAGNRLTMSHQWETGSKGSGAFRYNKKNAGGGKQLRSC